jgi:hypothetical protein
MLLRRTRAAAAVRLILRAWLSCPIVALEDVYELLQPTSLQLLADR